MVSEELVSNTIRKMRDAGLSESIIASTLQDLGLSTRQIQGFLSSSSAEGKSPITISSPTSSSSSSSPLSSSSFHFSPNLSSEHEALASRTSELMKQHLDNASADMQEEHALKDTITHLALEQHGEQLQDTHQSILELHDKLDGANFQAWSEKLQLIASRTEKMEEQLQDIKASHAAVMQLMQKVLEANQQLVFEIKKKN